MGAGPHRRAQGCVWTATFASQAAPPEPGKPPPSSQAHLVPGPPLHPPSSPKQAAFRFSGPRVCRGLPPTCRDHLPGQHCAGCGPCEECRAGAQLARPRDRPGAAGPRSLSWGRARGEGWPAPPLCSLPLGSLTRCRHSPGCGKSARWGAPVTSFTQPGNWVETGKEPAC